MKKNHSKFQFDDNNELFITTDDLKNNLRYFIKLFQSNPTGAVIITNQTDNSKVVLLAFKYYEYLHFQANHLSKDQTDNQCGQYKKECDSNKWSTIGFLGIFFIVMLSMYLWR